MAMSFEKVKTVTYRTRRRFQTVLFHEMLPQCVATIYSTIMLQFGRISSHIMNDVKTHRLPKISQAMQVYCPSKCAL